MSSIDFLYYFAAGALSLVQILIICVFVRAVTSRKDKDGKEDKKDNDDRIILILWAVGMSIFIIASSLYRNDLQSCTNGMAEETLPVLSVTETPTQKYCVKTKYNGKTVKVVSDKMTVRQGSSKKSTVAFYDVGVHFVKGEGTISATARSCIVSIGADGTKFQFQ
jgi:hypothetical protein